MPPVNSTGGICYKGEKSAYDREPPARVPYERNAARAFLSSLLRLRRQKDSALCGEREGLCPFTPPPFEKGCRVPVAHKQGADRSGSEDLDENFQYLYAPLLPQQEIPGKMPGISDFYDYAKSSACSSIFDKNQLCPLSGLP